MSRARPRIGGRWLVQACLVAAVATIAATASNLGAAAGTVRPLAAGTSSCPTLNLPTPICHVYVVFMENANVEQVMAQGKYEASLTTTYSSAGQYYSYMHYSFPNYLIATSGVATNAVAQVSSKSVGDLAQAHSPALTWASYSQTMPHACDRVSNGTYLSSHNPFVWYKDVYANPGYCVHHDLTFASFTQAVNSGNASLLPNYAFFAPNSTSDCHNASIAHCDAFLKNWLGPMLKMSFFNSTVWFITYDEGLDNSTLGRNGTTGGGHVYLSAVSPYACHNFTSQYNYSDYSLLTTTEWLLGLGHTGSSDNFSLNPPMRDLFCFPSALAPSGPSGIPVVPLVAARPRDDGPR